MPTIQRLVAIVAVRLDHGKAVVLDSRTDTSAVWLRTEAVSGTTGD